MEKKCIDNATAGIQKDKKGKCNLSSTKPVTFNATMIGNVSFISSSSCTSLQVLTDLCEEWYIMWLDGATMYQHPFASRDQAVGFIEELLAGRFDTSEGVQPSAFAARRELEPRLNVKHVRYVAHAEEMENFEGALDHEEVENMRHAHIIREALHPPSEPSWGKTSS